MGYEFIEITEKRYGIKDRGNTDWLMTIRYRKLVGALDFPENLEFDSIVSESPLIVNTPDSLKSEMDDLKARIIDLETASLEVKKIS
jgi:hypothetical protein